MITTAKSWYWKLPSISAKNVVRTIAMDVTDGLVRGLEVVNTGSPIEVPVGPEMLGRIINVIGDPVDGRGDIKTKTYYPIHRRRRLLSTSLPRPKF